MLFISIRDLRLLVFNSLSFSFFVSNLYASIDWNIDYSAISFLIPSIVLLFV